MQMLMGAWVSRVIYVVTRLNIPDVLKAQGPATAAELVSHGVTAKPVFLERVMRAAASIGLVTEDAAGKFGPTPLSDAVTRDNPASVKMLVESFGRTWSRVWEQLYESVRDGESKANVVFGMEFWDYLHANPEESELFGEAMKANSHASMQGVLALCDLSNVGSIVDVGGGFGHLAVALLGKYPKLRAAVLESADLIPIAKKNLPVNDPGVAARLEYVGGDMFQAVPAADAYILKHIIHDWNDAQCTQILRHCHASMKGNGRLLCVDAVVPPMGDTGCTPAKLLDLNMMVFIPGKERTRKQWEELYAAAGFSIKSITPLNDNFGTSIIEGMKS